MIVLVNNNVRKTEISATSDGFQQLLDTILEYFDIQGNITDVAYDGGTKYSVYCAGIPSISPVDFLGTETDPLANNLTSVKFDSSDNSFRAKVYYVGNNNNVTLDNGRPVAGTGIYVGEDSFTVYYPTEGDIPTDSIMGKMTQAGFSATTFYADETSSDESVYTQADAE